MLKTDLLLALRRMRAHPGYTGLNVAGLAVGLACCLLIVLFVQDEWRYDRVFANADRIYRLNKVVTPPEGGMEHHAISSGPMGPALAADYPEVEQAVRVLPWFDDVLLTRGAASHLVPTLVLADSNFFAVFDYTLHRGDPRTVLAAPQSIVLSASTARALFGDADPLGEVVRGLGDLDYTVTGVVEDPPARTHLDYDAFVSWASTVPGRGGLAYDWLTNWYPQALFTYLRLAPGADPAALEAALPGFMERHFPARADQYHLYLQPLRDVYLGSAQILHTRGTRGGNRTYVVAFSVIALLILGIACVNFVNLSTARAARRAQEVGVRKAMGAHRALLVRQFMGESFLLCAIALLLAAGLVELALPAVEAFTGKALLRSDLPPGWFLVVPVLLFGVSGLAGLYPALVLTRFDPVRALRGAAGDPGGVWFRRGLVVVQFVASTALVGATLVVYRQMDYLHEKNLGFRKEQMLVLPIGDTGLAEHMDAVRVRLAAHPGIAAVAFSNSVPGGGTMGLGIYPEGTAQDEGRTAQAIRVTDDDLLDAYGLELVAGRYFSDDRPADAEHGVVINEALARSLGWDDPVGKRFEVPGEVNEGVVIGVVLDFHFESLHRPIEPLFLYTYREALPDQLSIRLTGDDVPGTLAHIRRVWEANEPAYPFRYGFLDDTFAQFYRNERRMMQTLGFFAALAVGVACLGLFGLAAYAAERRRKEIGIRKVLGAGETQLVALLTKEFTLLVVLAFVLAAPLVYIVMDAWLRDFAYRIAVAPWMPGAAGLGTLLVAWATVGVQALRAARADPARTLRYE